MIYKSCLLGPLTISPPDFNVEIFPEKYFNRWIGNSFITYKITRTTKLHPLMKCQKRFLNYTPTLFMARF